jgi:limonene 1,2-monooxygenase
VVGFVHDWANPESTFRSWDLVARYVIPEINGFLTKLRESERHLQVNRGVFERASKAIMAKIMQNQDAAEALKVTQSPRFAAAGAQVPSEIGKKQAGKGKQAAE